MIEEFKTIKSFPDYEVSNCGRVRSLKCHKGKGPIILKQAIARGYLKVQLYKNKKGYMKHVHLLVWDNFGDKKRDGHKLEVDHFDGDLSNNRIDNLQLLTHRENIAKGYLNKRTSSKYTGVCWLKQIKKWSAKIHLGNFESEHDAHLAYQRAVKNI